MGWMPDGFSTWDALTVREVLETVAAAYRMAPGTHLVATGTQPFRGCCRCRSLTETVARPDLKLPTGHRLGTVLVLARPRNGA